MVAKNAFLSELEDALANGPAEHREPAIRATATMTV